MTFLLFIKKYWKVILFIGLLAANFYAGWEVKSWYIADQIEEERIKLAQEASEIIAEYAEREPEVIHDTKIIYRSFGNNLVCTDDERRVFSEAWNSISAGQTLGDSGEVSEQ